jgi:methyl-accepting chemotaxis protein
MLKLKIQGKLFIYILSTAVIIYIAAFGYLIRVMLIDAKENAVKLTDETAQRYAEITQEEFSKYFITVKTLNQSVCDYPKFSTEQRKKIYNPILNEILMNNPNFVAVWFTWERQYIENGYEKDYGRIRYACFNQGGFSGVKIDTLDQNGDRIGSMYYSLKIKPEEKLTEPYIDSYREKDSLRMATIAVPIMYKGNFAGLTGIDISLSQFQTITNQIQPYENSLSFLISNSGNFVAASDPALVNHPISEYFSKESNDELKDIISRGEKFSYFSKLQKKDFYISFYPLKVGNSTSPWSIGIGVPVDEIMSKVRISTVITILVALLGLVLLTAVILFFAKKITQPLEKTTNVVQDIADGDIDVNKKLSIDSGDEIADMRISVNRLIDNLNTTARFAVEIGKGNLDWQYQPLSEKDILGNALLGMRESLNRAASEDAKRREEDRKLNWATLGTAQFAEILRSNTENLEDFAYSIIKKLVKFIEVNQGGIFIINDSDPKDKFIELVAGFAFDRRKMLQKRIPPGVGLIGRCVLEKETIYMTKIPNDYINITSGLGEDNPNQLLIVPLVFNDEIFGVVELASFQNIEEYKIKFVERIGESIASTLSTVKINIQTSKLLRETKLKSEEMASQEEEIRQNMEEMLSSQDGLNEQVRDLSFTLKAVISTAYFVEYDMNGMITEISPRFLEFLQRRKEDVIGKYQGSFSSEPQNIEFFNNFWDQMRAGIPKRYYQELIIEGKRYKITGNYTPIISSEGLPYKVVNITEIETA